MKNRETWLHEVAESLRPVFTSLGYTLPPFRIAVGFTSKGESGARIGECWSDRSSADGHHEIFISPILSQPLDVAATLAHELVHAAVGIEAGHGKVFRKCALAIGLTGKMTATEAGDGFKAWWEPVAEAVGALPHARLYVQGTTAPGKGGGDDGEEGEPDMVSSGPKKQTTRLLKAICPHEECGYTVRVTRKWAEQAAPVCPVHMIPMTVEGLDGDD